MNNYPADLEDESFGRNVLDPFKSGQVKLNAGYYHRWYRFADKDAMGLMLGHRGFSDRNLYVAFNNHPNVSHVSVKYCENKVCDVNTARVSYAIPLEIIYLTPLNRWNPHNIHFWDDKDKNEVTKDKRTGGFEPSTAFNGVNSRNYYVTPSSFFSRDGTETDAADTADAVCGVLDGDGNVQNVTASGVRIVLPEIPGIEGNLRTRFPIFPVHEEGTTAYKEVEALRELVMDMSFHIEMFKKVPPFGSGDSSSSDDSTSNDRPDVVLYTSTSTKNPPGSHRHTVTLTYNQYIKIKLRSIHASVTSSVAAGHDHAIRVSYDSKEKRFRIHRCDDQKYCWDGHDKYLYEKAD